MSEPRTIKKYPNRRLYDTVESRYITLADVRQLTRWVRLDAVSARRYLLVRTANHRWAYQAARVSCSVFQLHRLFPRVANPLLRLRSFVDGIAEDPLGAVAGLRGRSAKAFVHLDDLGPENVHGPLEQRHLNGLGLRASGSG